MKLIHTVKTKNISFLKIIQFIDGGREKADLVSRCQSVDWRCWALLPLNLNCSDCTLLKLLFRTSVAYREILLKFHTRCRHWNSSGNNISPNIQHSPADFWSQDVVDTLGKLLHRYPLLLTTYPTTPLNRKLLMTTNSISKAMILWFGLRSSLLVNLNNNLIGETDSFSAHVLELSVKFQGLRNICSHHKHHIMLDWHSNKFCHRNIEYGILFFKQ